MYDKYELSEKYELSDSWKQTCIRFVTQGKMSLGLGIVCVLWRVVSDTKKPHLARSDFCCNLGVVADNSMDGSPVGRPLGRLVSAMLRASVFRVENKNYHK
jgi:hypothetical protein